MWSGANGMPPSLRWDTMRFRPHIFQHVQCMSVAVVCVWVFECVLALNGGFFVVMPLRHLDWCVFCQPHSTCDMRHATISALQCHYDYYVPWYVFRSFNIFRNTTSINTSANWADGKCRCRKGTLATINQYILLIFLIQQPNIPAHPDYWKWTRHSSHPPPLSPVRPSPFVRPTSPPVRDRLPSPLADRPRSWWARRSHKASHRSRNNWTGVRQWSASSLRSSRRPSLARALSVKCHRSSRTYRTFCEVT